MDAAAGKADPEVVAAPASIPEVPAASAAEPVAAVQADQPATVPAPAAEAPAQAAGAEPTAQPEVPKSLLDKFDDKQAAADGQKQADEPKVEESAKPADEVKADPTPTEEPKPDAAPETEKAAIEEPVKLDPIDWLAEDGGIKIPETITLNDESRTKLTEALELGRTDPKAGAQAMMNLGAEMAEQIAVDMAAKMWSTFADTRKGWETRTMADADLGGAGHDTAMGVVARMRDKFITRAEPGTPEHAQHMADWKELMQATGAGDHPALLRLLHNVGRAFDEGRAPPPDPKPPKDLGRKPGAKGQLNDDHPTSTPGN